MIRLMLNELRSPMMWSELGAICAFVTVILIVMA